MCDIARSSANRSAAPTATPTILPSANDLRSPAAAEGKAQQVETECACIEVCDKIGLRKILGAEDGLEVDNEGAIR